jgi:hypothetical protein
VLKSPENQNSCPEAVGYFQRALAFCEGATTQERSHIMQHYVPATGTEATTCEGKSVGEILDFLKLDVQKDMRK